MHVRHPECEACLVMVRLGRPLNGVPTSQGQVLMSEGQVRRASGFVASGSYKEYCWMGLPCMKAPTLRLGKLVRPHLT